MMNVRQCGVRSLTRVIWVFFTLTLFLPWPLSLSADQAQYSYDELGRLNAVVDGSGNAAVYQYDAVGNLLSVVRTTNAPPVITNLTPNLLNADSIVTLAIDGNNLFAPIITTSNPDVAVTLIPGGSEASVSLELIIPLVTTFGVTTLTVATPFGQDSTTFTILEAFTTVIGTVLDLDGAPIEGAMIDLNLGQSGLTATDGSFSFPNISSISGDVQAHASAIRNGRELVGTSLAFAPVPNAVIDMGVITITDLQYETDLGVPLPPKNNSWTFVPFAQGFAFPFFGTTYPGVFVSTEGKLTFDFGDGEKRENVNSLDNQPTIAPFWDDLNPGIKGEIYVNQFTNRLVVTWFQVPEDLNVGQNTFQAILFDDGRILFAYQGLSSDDAIVGISPDPSPSLTESDLTADTPLSQTGSVAIFEQFNGPIANPFEGVPPGDDPFDLDRRMVTFVPNINDGFDVNVLPLPEMFTTIVGTVVSENGTPVQDAVVGIQSGQSAVTASDGTFMVHQVPTHLGNVQVVATGTMNTQPLFGLSASIPPIGTGTTDVGTVTLGAPHFEEDFVGKPFILGNNNFALVPFTHDFTFPFFGTTYSEVYVNSNGRLTFASGDGDRSETVNEFNEQPGLAPFYDALSLNQARRDVIHVKQFPNLFVVTWDHVRERQINGENTFQVLMFADGRILFSYNRMSSDDAIVGITPGNSSTVSESNFTVETPLSSPGPIAIFEEFDGPLPAPEELTGNDPFDLDQKSVLFVPNASQGFDVTVTPPAVESGTTTIIGTLVDENGIPVAGATVSTGGGQTGLTDSTGAFSLADVPFSILEKLQMSTMVLINGQETLGVSAPVAPVPFGMTDVGEMVLGRKHRTLVSSTADLIAFVNLTTGEVASTPTVVDEPEGTAVTSDGQLGLVVHNPLGQSTLSFYDLTVDPPVFLDDLPMVGLQGANSVVVSPDDRFAIISATGQQDTTPFKLLVVDVAQRQVVSEVANIPRNHAIAITPDGAVLLMLDFIDDKVSVLTLDANGMVQDTGQRVTMPESNASITCIRITPNGKRALINDAVNNAVIVLAIDGTTVSVVDTVPVSATVSGGLQDLAISPDGTKAYASNIIDYTISVLTIDQTDTVMNSGVQILIPGGTALGPIGSAGLDLTFDGRTLLIPSRDRSLLSFMDTATNTLIPYTIFLPGKLNGISAYVRP